MTTGERDALIAALRDIAKLAKRIADRDGEPAMLVVAQRAADAADDVEAIA